MYKSLLVLATVIVIVAISFNAVPVQSAVPIPEQINVYLTGLVFVAVTAGFVWLFKYIGLDLRGYSETISGTLSLFIVGTLQNWVNLIPPDYDAVVTIAFNIIVVILSGIGSLYVLAKQRQSHMLLE